MNKRGRPKRWVLPLRQGSLPDKYWDKLSDLAYQWQQEELLQQSLSEYKQQKIDS